MFRRFLALFLVLSMAELAVAQSMIVKDFHLLERDLTANTEGTKRISPQDGNVSALIKVVTTEKGFNFDGGSYALVGNPEYKPGEIWIYVPARAQKLTISHSRFGVVRDYYYPVPIEAGRTYEMLLDPGVGKYVTIQTQTPRSSVYLDGDSIGAAPIYNLYILYGQHNLQAFNDHMEGSLAIDVINDGNANIENVTIPMFDQSEHFGKVIITTDRDAEIIMDGQVKGVGSWIAELREGNYVIETRKVNCDNAKTSFKVMAKHTENITAEVPHPHKGYLQLFSRPRDLQINLNGKFIPYSEHIDLPVGIQTITYSHKGYHSLQKEYDIMHNVTLSDTVNLARIQYLKRNGLYFGASYTIGQMTGVSGHLGVLYSNFDLQLSYMFGIDKSKAVNFYDSEGGFRSRTQYSLNSFNLKLGYQFRLATKFGIVPQLGYSVHFLNGNLIEGSETPGDGATCNCASIGGKFIFTPIQHFCLFAYPEYDLAISKNKTYEGIAKAAGFNCGGFFCNIGILINF